MEAIKFNGEIYAVEEMRNGNKKLVKLEFQKNKIATLLEQATDDELFEEIYRRSLARGEYGNNIHVD